MQSCVFKMAGVKRLSIFKKNEGSLKFVPKTNILGTIIKIKAWTFSQYLLDQNTQICHTSCNMQTQDLSKKYTPIGPRQTKSWKDHYDEKYLQKRSYYIFRRTLPRPIIFPTLNLMLLDWSSHPGQSWLAWHFYHEWNTRL